MRRVKKSELENKAFYTSRLIINYIKYQKYLMSEVVIKYCNQMIVVTINGDVFEMPYFENYDDVKHYGKILEERLITKYGFEKVQNHDDTVHTVRKYF